MLHINDLIERRYGQGPATTRYFTRLIMASLAVILLSAGLLLSGTSRAQDASSPATDAKATMLAIQLLDHLDAGQYAQAEAMFNTTMAQAVPADKLQAVWESLPVQAGEAQGRGEAMSMQQGEVTLVKIPLHYAKAALVAKLAIDGEGKIARFLVQPEEAPPAAAVTEDTPFAAAGASALAIQWLEHMDAGQYAQAEGMFSTQMAQAVPAAKLQEVWESLAAQAGEAQGRGEAVITQQGDVTLVKIPLHFAKAAALAAKVVIDAEGKIAGFMIQPDDAPPAAAVTEDAPFTETELSVGEGERALPGTLAMPKGVGQTSERRVPAIVLVHGSGPHDRDESVGPNKPFLDIARGLAAQGVAVLRYEKRTKARPQDFANGVYGVDDETTNDAVLAVDALRKVEGIDPARVFVLGHSQGGMMAPRIAAVSGHVAGLVLMAAPARSLLDIVIEQNRRLAVLDDGKTSDAERDAINALVQQVATTRNPATDPSTKTVMDLPTGYWRSIDAVDPVADATAVDLPMLVLQGARDIQVVDADWQRWRDGFHDNAKVEFKLYEKLNHLGIAGEGDGNIAEYANPGHVDTQLIDDVATWVKAH